MIIGILYPSSGTYPSIGSDFIEGIKVLFQTEGIESFNPMILEGIGFGGSEKEVYSKAEKLLRIDNVDVLIAFIDLRVSPLLEQLTNSFDKVLIIVNAGANYPYNWIPQPTTLYITLQHAFLCSLSGKLATEALPAHAAVATSFYDCGYLHVAAMTNSFVQGGGSIDFNFVPPQSAETFDSSPLCNFLTSSPVTDCLLCLLDENPAVSFYNQLATELSSFDLRLYVSPMMLENSALALLQQGIPFSIWGYRPWLPESDNQQNQLFTTTYRLHAKKEASLFALLGWETGLVLQRMTQQINFQTMSGTQLLDTLKRSVWQSPRGTVKLDEETHYLLAPAIQYHIGNGNISTQEIPIAQIQEHWSIFSATAAEGISSGWTNTYLCY